MLLLRVNERGIEPILIKKANQFVSFKFGNVQLLHILKFPGRTKSIDSFLRSYKTTESKGYFPYEWFDDPEKLDITQLLRYQTLFSKPRNENPLEKTIQTLNV